MMNDKVIEIVAGVTKKPDWQMAQPVTFELLRGEHVAITGRNGAGKTMFVDMLTGRHPVFPQMVSYHFEDSPHELVSDNIRYIAFRDTYGGDNDRTYFLQQRWNQMEIDEETPTVGRKLEEAFLMTGQDTPERRQFQQHLYQLLGLEPLLDKYLILLSSGELRKYKLASALFSQPRLLVMDNPFIGLDALTRDQLKQLLGQLAADGHLQIVLVLAKSDEIPSFITHVVEVSQMVVGPKLPLCDYLAQRPPFPTRVLSAEAEQALSALTSSSSSVAPTSPNTEATSTKQQEVISFHHVSIRYGERTILSDLDWTVMRGEHWALQGQNGSGKSTLLSLVCADNPQGYACDIRLFGHQRGTGESIWDIKRRIGYVSPEMHRSYKQNIPAWRIVASGLTDSIGLYARPTEKEKELCLFWMKMFGIGELQQRPFLTLSSGEQRLVLVARAFVKNPDLLILDEPLHGLDNHNRQLVKDVIEAYCQQPQKTLIMVTHYAEELPPCINHRLTLQRH